MRSARRILSQTFSVVNRDRRAAVHFLTNIVVSYRWAACNNESVESSLSKVSRFKSPVYKKDTNSRTASTSKSEIVTALSWLSLMPAENMAANTGDRAARTKECTWMCSSPTFNVKSANSFDSNKDLNESHTDLRGSTSSSFVYMVSKPMTTERRHTMRNAPLCNQPWLTSRILFKLRPMIGLPPSNEGHQPHEEAPSEFASWKARYCCAESFRCFPGSLLRTCTS
mmetsp:Transcript_36340/g.104641  ORF Transcript_36340/g.104641 Transcript_36340/m.104641 type:complete len:226 (+) Transcript_36340:277-954(+)